MKIQLNDNGVEAESLGKKQVAEMIKDAPKSYIFRLELYIVQGTVLARFRIYIANHNLYDTIYNVLCVEQNPFLGVFSHI